MLPAHGREKDSEKPIPGSEAQQIDNVITVPDNNRDLELTEELRRTQDRYYAKQQRRQSLSVKGKSDSDQ